MAKAKKKLTKSSVEQEACRDGRAYFVWDTEQPGFGLRVGRSTKSFVVQRDLPGGRSRRVTIGRYPAWSVPEARKEARALIVQFDRGVDPAVARREAAVRGITLREARAAHVDRMRHRDCSPRSIECLEGEVERHLGDWLDRPLREISPADVQRRHRRITTGSGPYVANRVGRHLRAIWNTCRRTHRDLGDPPTSAIDWNKQRRRREPIAWDALPAWLAEVEQLPPVRRDYNFFVLLTGLRATDAKTVRWEHVDFEAGTLHRPQPKGGVDRAFTIPLSSAALDVLQRRRDENCAQFADLGGDAGWAFPCVVRREGRRCIVELQETKEKRTKDGKKRTALPTPHRLRDTFASAAHEARVHPMDLKILMNHRLPSGDVTEGYIRPSEEHLRTAVDAIAGFLDDRMVRAAQNG